MTSCFPKIKRAGLAADCIDSKIRLYYLKSDVKAERLSRVVWARKLFERLKEVPKDITVLNEVMHELLLVAGEDEK